MREAVRRRLSVEASELLTPLPLSFPLGVSSSVPQRFVTVNWGPTASRQHRSRGLRHRQGRNLNCSATRKCSRPVDGRRPQTFDPPGRLLGSAAQDLLAQPASLGDRACCLQTTAPSETARPIAAGCRSVGGMARLFGSRSASSIPNSGQQGQIEPDLPRSEPGDFGQQSGRRSLRQPKPLCLGVGELRPRQPIRRATSSRLSPAARRRTRAPASRSAIKRTIGSGCAASIAAASVIGSLIGHSARGGSTTTTEKFRHRLPSRRALSARIASGLRRTHGGGGSRLAFGLCRPAPVMPVMARKLRPALVCAPPRRSRRLPHTARLAEGRTEPDFEPAEPNDRAVVVVGRCSCRTRPQCAPTAAFRRAARMCRSNVSRCASRPSPETPCLSVEARRY